MGQQPNKYHISDDGKIYRVNDDGSFTSMGSVKDIDKSAPEKPSGADLPQKANWWKRNYNWLWVTMLVLFIGWIAACMSCSFIVDVMYENGQPTYYQYSNGNIILLFGILVTALFGFSWWLSSKRRKVLLLIQLLLLFFAYCCLFYSSQLCNDEDAFIIWNLSFIPLIIWIITLILTIVKQRRKG